MNKSAANAGELLGELSGLLENSVWITNLANTSALLMQHLPRINWAGFYLYDGKELVLGPFQGLPACLKIPMGKGVCGTAAASRETIVVEDVHKFPGHIACDSRSNSEIVVPIVAADGRLIGVLDVDSPEVGRFSQDDRETLEQVVRALVARTNFPEKMI
jgi:L-methionine (R)-S-oxide reductase